MIFYDKFYFLWIVKKKIKKKSFWGKIWDLGEKWRHRKNVIIFFLAPTCSLSVGAHLWQVSRQKHKKWRSYVGGAESAPPPPGTEEPPKGPVLIGLRQEYVSIDIATGLEFCLKILMELRSKRLKLLRKFSIQYLLIVNHCKLKLFFYLSLK